MLSKYDRPMQCNLAITNFLDVAFNLKYGTYYSYRKQNTEILHIRKQSNHPPFIIKQISSKKSKRVSDISLRQSSF